MESPTTLSDWKVVAINDHCITITVNAKLSIEGIKFKVLGENRNFLFDITPTTREITFCTPTGNPMFVELHSETKLLSVHYVEGSGSDFYKK